MSSTTSRTASCSCRSASRTASACFRELADVHYKVSSYYDPETEAGIAWDDPDVAVQWPVSDPQVSERDRSAPKLAEIGEQLPF